MGNLVKRKPNAATIAAAQANGRKARGAITERGRSISGYNAAKHWGRAESMRRLMPTLDEHEKEFESLRKALYDSLAPQDGFEALIIDDMADIHWRLRRMLRGEAGQLAKQRRLEMARVDEQEAAAESGRLRDIEPSLAKLGGVARLEDSGAKFSSILDKLNLVGLLVQEQGFAEEGVLILKYVYGRIPGGRAENLISLYQSGLSAKSAGDAQRDEQCQAAFHDLLRREIFWFRERADSERHAREELRLPRIEAAMVEGRFDPAKAVYYQEAMERRFERKWRLLEKYRRTCRAARQFQEEQESAAEAGDQAVEDTVTSG